MTDKVKKEAAAPVSLPAGSFTVQQLRDIEKMPPEKRAEALAKGNKTPVPDGTASPGYKRVDVKHETLDITESRMVADIPEEEKPAKSSAPATTAPGAADKGE